MGDDHSVHRRMVSIGWRRVSGHTRCTACARRPCPGQYPGDRFSKGGEVDPDVPTVLGEVDPDVPTALGEVDARRGRPGKPGDHPGAFSGVGGCDLFPDQDVEQG
jgi:hypothetical protein